ncbi:MAG: MerR family transcriptional regulator [Piscinibacter sp.]|nr:MerR family transcriptional regulator [Piscinibacter sp.]
MFRIGDFSRIARVSARLLRFYDEMGLFAPAHADPQTGYRYYTLAQLGELNRITVLKELGFSLDEVRDLLRAPPDPAALRQLLLLRRQAAERALAAEAYRLRVIESRIAQIETEGRLSAEDVVVRAEPARPWLSARRTVASFAQAREWLGELRRTADPALGARRGTQVVVLMHTNRFEPDELDLEIGYAFDGELPRIDARAGGLAPGLLPAVPRMAVCVRVGPPDEAHLVTARVGRFLELSGDRFDGPGREAFLHLPPPDRMLEAVVEMQFPLGGGC